MIKVVDGVPLVPTGYHGVETMCPAGTYRGAIRGYKDALFLVNENHRVWILWNYTQNLAPNLYLSLTSDSDSINAKEMDIVITASPKA